jgi:hypothetical protein
MTPPINESISHELGCDKFSTRTICRKSRVFWNPPRSILSVQSLKLKKGNTRKKNRGFWKRERGSFVEFSRSLTRVRDRYRNLCTGPFSTIESVAERSAEGPTSPGQKECGVAQIANRNDRRFCGPRESFIAKASGSRLSFSARSDANCITSIIRLWSIIIIVWRRRRDHKTLLLFIPLSIR